MEGSKSQPGTPAKNPATLRVLVICRSTLQREGMQRVLDSHPLLEVVGSAALLRDALDIIRKERPDIALLWLAGSREVELIGFLAEQSSAVKIVGIAESISEDTLIAALEAGMVAVIGPDAGVNDLVTTFYAVQRGEFPCSPRTAAILQRRLHQLARTRTQSRPWRLTLRERDIMMLVKEGLSNDEISRRLCVELSTVKNHLHNIFEKLGVHSRAEATSLLTNSGHPPVDGSRSPQSQI